MANTCTIISIAWILCHTLSFRKRSKYTKT